jgi:hypothetical protein
VLVVPLNFLDWVKITDFAGIFNPIANVDVANTTYKRPSVNNISTISFKIGIMPA